MSDHRVAGQEPVVDQRSRDRSVSPRVAPTAIAAYRAAFGVLTLVAIAVQMSTLIGDGRFIPTRFFAFFTILSNLYGALLLLALAVRWRAPRSPLMDLLRGASVVYLVVTFIVVIVLLSGADLQLAIPWVDFVLHKVLPVVVVIDWIIDPPVDRLGLREVGAWLVFPALWIVFTLARGALDGWYPYPFLDPAHGGYVVVAAYCVAILVGFLAIAAVTVAIGNLRWSARDR